MCGVVAVGSEGVGGVHSIVSFAFEVVSFEVFDEIIETAIVVFGRGLFLAGLSVHITTITPHPSYREDTDSFYQII